MNNEPRVIEADDMGHEEGSFVTTDASTLAILNKSEIDQQITTAKAYPRSVTNFLKDAVALVTLDKQTAAECNYALPRGGKVISGPSARFAEIIAYAWGNCKAGARVVGEDEEFVTAQGIMYDLEKNVAITYEVKRRITDSKGRRYNADMIGVTANAASSIALRNAVLKGIPKALWNPAYKRALTTIAGKTETLGESRKNALQELAAFQVTPDMVFRVLGINGQQDITLDHIVVLHGMITALREGDSTVEEMFKTDSQRNGEHLAEGTQAKQADLREKYANGGKKAAPKKATPPAQANSHAAEGSSAVVDSPEVKQAQENLERARAQVIEQPTGSQLFGEPATQD